MRLKPCAFCLIILLGLSATPFAVLAGTVTVVGNLDEGSGSSQTIVPLATNAPGSSPYWISQEFGTGATGGTITLTQIFASLGLFQPSNNNDFTLTAELDSNASGNLPGTKIADLTQNGSFGVSSFNNVEFDAVGTVTLNANTSYWFTLEAFSSDGSGSVDWQYANTITPSSGTGSLSYYASSTDGLTWSSIPVSAPYNTPFLIQVNGSTAVPEPATWLLGTIGLSTMLVVSRQWRMRRRAR